MRHQLHWSLIYFFQGHSFMTEIATIDWFGRWGTSVFSENTAIFLLETMPLWDQQGLLSFQGFMLRDGARGQHLGHHRFCLISWRLVDGWILCLICWFSVTQTLTWIYGYRSVTYISWSTDFALYIEDSLMEKCHNLDIGSMWCKDLSH